MLDTYEQSPTSAQERFFVDVPRAVDAVTSSYGSKPRSLPRRKLHVVARGSVKPMTDGQSLDAFYSITEQTIVVEDSPSNTKFAIALGHELFHVAGYTAAQISEGYLKPYRSGITVYDKEAVVEYFGALDEALVAELTYRFYESDLRKHPLCREEIEATEAIKTWILDSARRGRWGDREWLETLSAWLAEIYVVPDVLATRRVLKGNQANDAKLDYLKEHYGPQLEGLAAIAREGLEERPRFNRLLDEILSSARSKGEPMNHEDLFSKFARAHFTGNILPIARIIEHSLGKGAFRRIAYEFREEPTHPDSNSR